MSYFIHLQIGLINKATYLLTYLLTYFRPYLVLGSFPQQTKCASCDDRWEIRGNITKLYIYWGSCFAADLNQIHVTISYGLEAFYCVNIVKLLESDINVIF